MIMKGKDFEVKMIHGHQVAKTAGQTFNFNHR